MKLKGLLLTVAAFVLLLSFSPWEGAAGVAPDGELPASGFFIATNSFPRNTVVDVTNLETGKTTRAIVANTLTNPGLLAVVSRDAAGLIGMRAGSISRIRILSPSDPIAYQRFTEGLAQEMPPFDSGNIIKSEEELLNEVYGRDAYVPGAVAQAQPERKSDFSGPSYQIEPEWGGTARLEIVDIPRFYEPPAGPFVEQPKPVQEPPAQIVQPPVQIVLPPAEEPPVQIVQPQAVREPEPPVQSIVRQPEIEMQEDIVKDIPSFIAEHSAQDIDKQTSGFYPETAQSDAVKDVPSYVPVQPSSQIVKSVPEFFYDTIFSEIAKNVEGFISEEALADIAKDIPSYNRESDYDTVAKAVPEFLSNTPNNVIVKDVPAYIPESHYYDIAKSVEGFIAESPADAIAKDVGRFTNEGMIDAVAKDVERFITGQNMEQTAKHLERFFPDSNKEEIVKFLEGFDSEKSQDELVKYLDGFYPERSPEELAKYLERYYPEVKSDEMAKYLDGFYPERSPEELAKYLERFYSERTPEEIAKAVSQFEEAKIAEREVVVEVIREVIREAAREPEPSREPEQISEIPPEQQPAQSEFTLSKTGNRIPEPPLYGINLNDIIPGIATSAPERRSTPESRITSPVTEPSFSIRSISVLDRGQYYVQIASIPENSVENTLRQFDQQFLRYNPGVYRDRDNSYRILIGPLNQGESAAILARFKSIGYRDAYVRRGG